MYVYTGSIPIYPDLRVEDVQMAVSIIREVGSAEVDFDANEIRFTVPVYTGDLWDLAIAVSNLSVELISYNFYFSPEKENVTHEDES